MILSNLERLIKSLLDLESQRLILNPLLDLVQHLLWISPILSLVVEIWILLHFKNLQYNFTKMILKEKLEKDWNKLKKNKLKVGGSKKVLLLRLLSKLINKHLKYNSNPLLWHLQIVLWVDKLKNKHLKDSNQFKNQSKNKSTKENNNNLSLLIKSNNKKEEKKEKKKWNNNKLQFKLNQKLDFLFIKVFTLIFYFDLKILLLLIVAIIFLISKLKFIRYGKCSIIKIKRLNDKNWSVLDNFMIIFAHTAAAPEIISHNSMVILACLALL